MKGNCLVFGYLAVLLSLLLKQALLLLLLLQQCHCSARFDKAAILNGLKAANGVAGSCVALRIDTERHDVVEPETANKPPTSAAFSRKKARQQKIVPGISDEFDNHADRPQQVLFS